MHKESLELKIQNKIAYLTFFSPKSNSLSSNLLEEMIIKINDISNKSDVNLLVIQSNGNKAFCAGASFDELIQIANYSDGKLFFMNFANLINAIRKCSKIVIGRVQGKVVGGGVGLVAACDYCLATKYAELKLSELALGLGPFVVGPPIERKVGKKAFVEMSLDCEWRNSTWAKENGFYHEVYDSIEELDKQLSSFTQKLSERSSEALFSLKQMFWEDTDHWDTLLEKRAEHSGRLVLSNYTKNFIEKFRNK